MEPDRGRPEIQGAAAFHPRRHARFAREPVRPTGNPPRAAGRQDSLPGQGTGPRDLGKLPRWLGQFTTSTCRAQNDADPRASGREPAESRADDGAGAATGFRPAPEGIRRAESSCSTQKATPSPASPPRCAAPAAMARRRWPRRSPTTPTSRTPISTESSGPSSAKSRSGCSDPLRPHRPADGRAAGLETITAAAAKLGEALGDRRILMVVDDAWREQDLRPFLQGGPNCVRLVTTRIDSVLPAESPRQPVDAMQAGEALRLLSAGLPAGSGYARRRRTLRSSPPDSANGRCS